MRIKKNGKVITLTESDLNRIVKKVLNEQEIETKGGTTSKYHKVLVPYIDKKDKVVPMALALIKLEDLNDDKVPFGISSYAASSGDRTKFDSLRDKWAKTKYQDNSILKQLSDMIQSGKISDIKVFGNNGDGLLKYKYKAPYKLGITSS